VDEQLTEKDYEFAVNYLTKRIRKSKTYYFQPADLDDIRQDFLLSLLNYQHQFDPAKSTKEQWLKMKAVWFLQGELKRKANAPKYLPMRDIPYTPKPAIEYDPKWSERERTILEMLAANHSITEIASHFNLSIQRISQLIEGIREKYHD